MVAYGLEALLQKVADTGPAGAALINGTETILSWAVPDDGRLHTFVIAGSVLVTSAETGGAITFTCKVGGSTRTGTAHAGGGGAGVGGFNAVTAVADPGSVVSLQQSSALTAGAAAAYAQIWAA